MVLDAAAPRGVWVASSFFALSGVLEIAFALADSPHPVAFWSLWDTLGRGLPHFALAFGLWNRLALSRSIAMVYCLAVLATYGAALGLALAHAPLRYPPSVVVQSLFQIPSCALLFPYLRSARAALLFGRPLFGR